MVAKRSCPLALLANKLQTELCKQSFANKALRTLSHQTRGQMLVKLNRWQAAIFDLEVALETPELRPAIYPSLALAYEKIGQADMSRVYQNLVKRTP